MARTGWNDELTELEERMLFIESLETIRCFDEGVLRSVYFKQDLRDDMEVWSRLPSDG